MESDEKSEDMENYAELQSNSARTAALNTSKVVESRENENLPSAQNTSGVGKLRTNENLTSNENSTQMENVPPGEKLNTANNNCESDTGEEDCINLISDESDSDCNDSDSFADTSSKSDEDSSHFEKNKRRHDAKTNNVKILEDLGSEFDISYSVASLLAEQSSCEQSISASGGSLRNINNQSGRKRSLSNENSQSISGRECSLSNESSQRITNQIIGVRGGRLSKENSQSASHLSSQANEDCERLCLCEKCSTMLPSEQSLLEHCEQHHGKNDNALCEVEDGEQTVKTAVGNENDVVNALHSRKTVKNVVNTDGEKLTKESSGRTNRDLNKASEPGKRGASGFSVTVQSVVLSADIGVEKKYCCIECPGCFRTKEELLNHQKEQHCEKHACTRCPLAFLTAKGLSNHQRRHPELGTFHCKQCTNRFFSRHQLAKHQKHTHHKQKTVECRTVRASKIFHCSECPAMFATPKDLKMHLHLKHGNVTKFLEPPLTFCCKKCNALFNSQANLQRHTKIKHRVKVQALIRCKECSNVFYDAKAFSEHQAMHRKGTVDTSFQTQPRPPVHKSTLQQQFATLKSKDASTWNTNGVKSDSESDVEILGDDEAISFFDGMFSCLHCSLKYTALEELNAHEVQAHGQDEGPFFCDQCSETLPSKEELAQHEKSHCVDKLYQCDICPAGFTEEDDLHSHKRLHNSDRPHRCDRCPARFKDKADLESHAMTHPDPDSVYLLCCDLCSDAFETKAELKTHNCQKGDSSSYSKFKCDLCSPNFPSTFFTLRELNVHKETHAPPQRMSWCKLCHQPCLGAAELIVHDALCEGRIKERQLAAGKNSHLSTLPSLPLGIDISITQPQIANIAQPQVALPQVATSSQILLITNAQLSQPQSAPSAQSLTAMTSQLSQTLPVSQALSQPIKQQLQFEQRWGQPPLMLESGDEVVIRQPDREQPIVVQPVVVNQPGSAQLGVSQPVISGGPIDQPSLFRTLPSSAPETDHTTIFNCMLCNFSETNCRQTRFPNHVELTHFTYPCLHCPCKFRLLTDLSMHRIVMHGEESLERFPCEVCGETFPDLPHWRRHRLGHENNCHSECEQCGARFRNHQGFRTFKLMAHKRLHKNLNSVMSGAPISNDLVCDHCLGVFSLPQKLMKHRMKVYFNTPDVFKCTSCPPHTSLQQNSLSINTSQQHFESSARTSLQQSGESSASFETSLKQQCVPATTVTDKTEPSSVSLTADTPVVGSQQDSKLLMCTLCCDTFHLDLELRRHLCEHSFAYSCQICLARFLFRKDLIRHWADTGHDRIDVDSPVAACVVYCCQQCNYRHVNYNGVCAHRKKFGELDYMCALCLGSFSESMELTRHLLRCHFPSQSMKEHEGWKKICRDGMSPKLSEDVANRLKIKLAEKQKTSECRVSGQSVDHSDCLAVMSSEGSVQDAGPSLGIKVVALDPVSALHFHKATEADSVSAPGPFRSITDTVLDRRRFTDQAPNVCSQPHTLIHHQVTSPDGRTTINTVSPVGKQQVNQDGTLELIPTVQGPINKLVMKEGRVVGIFLNPTVVSSTSSTAPPPVNAVSLLGSKVTTVSVNPKLTMGTQTIFTVGALADQYAMLNDQGESSGSCVLATSESRKLCVPSTVTAPSVRSSVNVKAHCSRTLPSTSSSPAFSITPVHNFPPSLNVAPKLTAVKTSHADAALQNVSIPGYGVFKRLGKRQDRGTIEALKSKVLLLSRDKEDQCPVALNPFNYDLMTLAKILETSGQLPTAEELLMGEDSAQNEEVPANVDFNVACPGRLVDCDSVDDRCPVVIMNRLDLPDGKESLNLNDLTLMDRELVVKAGETLEYLSDEEAKCVNDDFHVKLEPLSPDLPPSLEREMTSSADLMGPLNDDLPPVLKQEVQFYQPGMTDTYSDSVPVGSTPDKPGESLEVSTTTKGTRGQCAPAVTTTSRQAKRPLPVYTKSLVIVAVPEQSDNKSFAYKVPRQGLRTAKMVNDASMASSHEQHSDDEETMPVSLQNDSRYKCPHCPATFYYLAEWRNHVGIHSGGLPEFTPRVRQTYRCGKCPYAVNNLSKWKAHAITHTGEKPVRCLHCPSRFTQQSTLNRHIKIHSGDRRFKCSHCNASFSDSTLLKRHLVVHRQRNIFKCKECRTSFPTYKELKSHRQIHEGDDDSLLLFIDSIDGGVLPVNRRQKAAETATCFALGGDDELARKPHSEEPVVSAEGQFLCSYQAQVSSATHIAPAGLDRSRTWSVEEQQYAVKVEPHSPSLDLETQREAGSKERPKDPHVEEVLAGLKNVALMSKQRVRVSSTPICRRVLVASTPMYNIYTCDFCPTRFRTKIAKIRHRKVHFQKKALKCPFCTATYNSQLPLRTHKQVHQKDYEERFNKRLTEPAFECPECPAVFTLARGLVRHQSNHRLNFPYRCALCTASFPTKRSLQRHKLLHFSTPVLTHASQEGQPPSNGVMYMPESGCQGGDAESGCQGGDAESGCQGGDAESGCQGGDAVFYGSGLSHHSGVASSMSVGESVSLSGPLADKVSRSSLQAWHVGAATSDEQPTIIIKLEPGTNPDFFLDGSDADNNSTGSSLNIASVSSGVDEEKIHGVAMGEISTASSSSSRPSLASKYKNILAALTRTDEEAIMARSGAAQLPTSALVNCLLIPPTTTTHHKILTVRNDIPGPSTSPPEAAVSGVDRSSEGAGDPASDAQTGVFQCDMCPAVFSRKRSFNQHCRVHVDISAECSLCEGKFTTRYALNRHRVQHHGDKPYECGLCDASFTRISSLQRHGKQHVGVKDCQCPKCPKTFFDPDALRSHMKQHRNQRFCCLYCHQWFKSQLDLRIHKLSHSDSERPWKCSLCPMSYKKKNVLIQHIRTHTGVKPYKCRMCTAAFTRSEYLRRHIRTHTGDRPYKCEICPAAFACNSGLHSHMKLHNNEHPYQCDVCRMSFKYSCTFRVHECSKQSLPEVLMMGIDEDFS